MQADVRSPLIAIAVVVAGLLGFAQPRDLPHIEWNDNRKSAGDLIDGRLLLDLEVRRGAWRPLGEDGDSVEVLAFAEVGSAPLIPGPLISVPEGTDMVMTVMNPLDAPLELQGLSSRLHPDFDRENTRNYPGEDLPTLVVAPGGNQRASLPLEATIPALCEKLASPGGS